MAALTLTGDANPFQSGYYAPNSLTASVIGSTSRAGGMGGVLGAVLRACVLILMASIMRVTDKVLWFFDSSPLIQPLFEGDHPLACDLDRGGSGASDKELHSHIWPSRQVGRHTSYLALSEAWVLDRRSCVGCIKRDPDPAQRKPTARDHWCLRLRGGLL